MQHEGKRIDEEIKRLERELECPVDPKKRIAVQQAINHLRSKKRSWEAPH